MIKWLKIALFNWVIRDIWKGITPDSYLKIDQAKGTITLLADEDSKEGQVMTGEETREYISEANAILRLPLFLKMNGSMKNVANSMIFKRSKTIDDILAGKMILWSLEVMEKKYQNIASLKIAEKKKA